jgi:hypothetical protein
MEEDAFEAAANAFVAALDAALQAAPAPAATAAAGGFFAADDAAAPLVVPRRSRTKRARPLSRSSPPPNGSGGGKSHRSGPGRVTRCKVRVEWRCRRAPPRFPPSVV